MAEIQQFNLGQLLGQAEAIKGARRQNQLAEMLQPLQMEEAELSLANARSDRTSRLAGGAIALMGSDWTNPEAWARGVTWAEQQGADVTPFKDGPSVEKYKLIQQLASGGTGGQQGFSYGGSQLVERDGKIGYIVPRYGKDGSVTTVFAEAGDGFNVLGSGGVSARERSQLDIQTEEEKARRKAAVETDTAQQVELQKVLGREGAQRYTELQKAAQSASEFLPRLEDLQRLAATVETGATAEISMLAKRALGIDTANMEELNAKLGELAQDILNQQTGTKTDFDFQNAVRQSASIGKTPEANRRLIEALIERQRQAVRFGDMAAQALQERGAQGILDLRYVPPSQGQQPQQGATTAPAPTAPQGGSQRMRFNPATGRLEPSR